MASAASVRSALRSVLRAIDTNVTSVSGNDQWHKAAVQMFRQAGVSEERARDTVALAQDYTRLILNVAHHRALLAEYNIGVDVEERSKKMIAATARRVGFQLPDRLPEFIDDSSSSAVK